MSRSRFVPLYNGEALPLDRVPALPLEEFQAEVLEAAGEGLRVASFFAGPGGDPATVELHAVLADDLNGRLLLGRSSPRSSGGGSSFPSLTPRCPQLHLFEREVAEQAGIEPAGHPWLKPVRFAPALAGAGATGERIRPPIGTMDFYRVEGEEVHEVAVGPVHAGVIEPGHFRFQCHGEQVFHLEISLGYQHRGIEEAARGGPHPLTPHHMQTAAGDSTIAHHWAYCLALESLSGTPVPVHAHVVRSIALELERLANHTGDLGALAGDVGYLPTASYCGRIRGDFLNMTAVLCGNRFGRGLLRPGGTRFAIEPRHREDLLRRLEAAAVDVKRAVELLWTSPSVMARFENTGPLSREDCLQLGLVGPAARASGVERDVRNDHPTGLYRFTHIPVATALAGDVHSRAFVRWLEIQRSLDFIRKRLETLPAPAEQRRPGPLAPRSAAVSLIEGWRGEVCHVALTDEEGRFSRYKITDPSFHNWMGLALALRGQQISDFPLVNKSFNLSYCGHDL